MELTNMCKKCMGCNRLEDPNFKGVYRCKYATAQLNLEELQREMRGNE